MNSKAQHFFALLKGHWDFYRTLTKHGTAEGVASFKELNTFNLYYKEEGIWIKPNQTQHQVYRDYIYCYDPGRDKITAYFTDNHKPAALFHELIFTTPWADPCLIAEGYHQCKNDHYKAQYIVKDNDQFCLSYIVKGLNKNYVSETTFHRLRCSEEESPGGCRSNV